ncbi:DUF6924 domain-containing protein [Streptomyces sp. NPDC006487]|uniref:DUF6924 domain-containing protein n=1 Tax=Streptomyces sp. NPDC006487 TaxID=3364748 RepID=UPI00368359D4
MVAHATYVSEARLADVDVRELVEEEAAAPEDGRIHQDPGRPLLAVDLEVEPGRTFRVPVRWFPRVSAHLSLWNMDFAEYADAADGSGTFRGFGRD